MPIIVHKPGFDRAVQFIKKGSEVEHDSNNWEEEKPTLDEEVRFLNSHSLDEYGSWFLGIKTDADPKARQKFVYPWGDLSVMHKSALEAAEKNASKNGHPEIAAAAKKLLEMLKQNKK